MARDFTKSTVNYMSLGTNALSSLLGGAGTVCGHAWIWVDTFDTGATDNKILTVILDGANEGLSLLLSGASPVLKVQGRSETGETLRSLSGATPVPTGQWVSVGFRCDFADDADNAVFLNGVSDNDGAMSWDTTAYTPGVPTLGDRIGSHPGGVVTQWFDGRIAELALWTGDIGNDGFAALANGWHPPEVSRPASHFELLGDEYGSAILMMDDFTGANGTSLDANNSGTPIWTESQGAWEIQSNQAITVGATPPPPRWVAVAEGRRTDVEITCLATLAGTLTAGIVLRCQDSNNFWTVDAYQAAGELRLGRYVAGAWQQKDVSPGHAISPGVPLSLTARVEGNDFYGSLNDGGGTVTYTDGFLADKTVHGLRGGELGATFDDFKATGTGFRDAYGNRAATITGTIAKADHPPMRMGIWIPQWWGNAVAVAAFDPDDYGTPIWDMDAAEGAEEANGDPCEDGDSVLNCLDQSATGADYDQTTGAKKPTFHTNVASGHPVVRFDGLTQYLEPANSATFGAFTELTCLWVFQITDEDSLDIVHYYRDTVGQRAFWLLVNTESTNTGISLYVQDDGGDVVVNSADVDPAAAFVVVTATIKQNDQAKLWANNVLKDSAAIGLLDESTAGSSQISGNSPSGNILKGDIARMVYYGAISEANRSAATAALMAKYGIS